ncbi:hypothetical protein sos41_40300 [Alphaproteobacteria bacterium SO-S41]|nr:hypothetical protein sos41_40300 [Alphaproteobacteria bacterium SO-S41]
MAATFRKQMLSGRRPRLSVSVMTRDSEQRLGRLLNECRAFADEIVVGVDASSTDQTLEVARAHADVVYLFRHSGRLSEARMLPLRYATGDWILSLDDDESMEESFDAILHELVTDRSLTHRWFPRKWIVSLDPCEYLCGSPWYPDWQLRLFRNDPTIVWKPPRPHSGYHVLGPGCLEERASILHFEPVWCSEEDRLQKVERYRRQGAAADSEVQYGSLRSDAGRKRTTRRDPQAVWSGDHRRLFDPLVHEFSRSEATGWGAKILSAEMSPSASAGGTVQAEVCVRNTGTRSWAPIMGALRSADLNLTYHVLDSSGSLLQRGGRRFPIPRFVSPGSDVRFICEFGAPAAPGLYQIEWDLVNDGECWFSEVGGETLRSDLTVRPNHSAEAPAIPH